MFPTLGYHVDLTRPGSLSTVRKAIDTGKRIVIGFHKALQKGSSTRSTVSDFWETGCEAVIKDISDQGDAKCVFVEGVRRVRICAIRADKGLYSCDFEPIGELEFEMTDHLGELAMYLQSLALGLESTAAFSPMVKPRTSGDLGRFVDTIAFKIASTSKERIRLLRATDTRKRIEMLHMILTHLVERENERIAEQTVKEMAGQQSGGSTATITTNRPEAPVDVKDSEVKRLTDLVAAAGMSDEAKAIASGELQRLQLMSTSSSEYNVTVTYLDILAGLPWSKMSEDRVDIEEARRVLDEDHYGLQEPKERILEFLAVRKLTAKNGGAILCFTGPPGVGKTSLGRSIAKATGRVFIRTSLGGVRDEAEIRGHRRTYISALPGRILQELRKADVRNPVFMLDEIDKLSKDVHGDPASALLEALDSEQNFAFKDNYLGAGFDLSQTFFIGTANDVYGMPPALRDRLEIVEIPGYSAMAKSHIARKYLIPKQKEKNGLADRDIVILDEAIDHIIGSYTSEAGVRVLERCCGSIFRKLAVYAAAERDVPSTVDTRMVKELLGPPKLFVQKMADKPLVGTSTGLAWSAAGGSILFVESALIPGSGGLEMTGNLGQILQESAQVAHTWILTNAKRFGMDTGSLEKKTIRIHLPAGAIPKDGPSAGLAMVVSVFSLLFNIPARNDIAMTGEISLRGKVMPVGGIVEKLLAAHRAGIREIILPKDNTDSLTEVPEEVAREMRIHLVDQLDEVLDIALVERKEIAT